MVQLKKLILTPVLLVFLQNAQAQTAAATQYEFNSERTTSAIRVSNEQEVLDGNLMSTAWHKSTQALATAIATILQTEKIKKAHFDHNGSTGQPITTQCDAINDNHRTAVVKDQKDIFKNEMAKIYAATPYDSAVTQEKDMLETHNSAFCSVAQAYQGMCKLVGNGLQNADANYSVSFMMPTLQGDAHIAGLQFASNLSKFTYQIPPESCTNNGKLDCQHSQLTNLDLMAESSLINTVLFDQLHARMRPQLIGKITK